MAYGFLKTRNLSLGISQHRLLPSALNTFQKNSFFRQLDEVVAEMQSPPVVVFNRG